MSSFTGLNFGLPQVFDPEEDWHISSWRKPTELYASLNITHKRHMAGFASCEKIDEETDEELDCDDPEVPESKIPASEDQRDKLSEYEESLKSPYSEFFLSKQLLIGDNCFAQSIEAESSPAWPAITSPPQTLPQASNSSRDVCEELKSEPKSKSASFSALKKIRKSCSAKDIKVAAKLKRGICKRRKALARAAKTAPPPVSHQKLWVCDLCPNRKTFDTSQALGGHRSKAHPGQSREYSHKQEVRKMREHARRVLKLAKQLIANDPSIRKDVKVSRSVLEAHKVKARAILAPEYP
jgi:hypothetical protein